MRRRFWCSNGSTLGAATAKQRNKARRALGDSASRHAGTASAGIATTPSARRRNRIALTDQWVDFLREQRLLPQLALASQQWRQRGAHRSVANGLCERLDDFFSGYRPAAFAASWRFVGRQLGRCGERRAGAVRSRCLFRRSRSRPRHDATIRRFRCAVLRRLSSGVAAGCGRPSSESRSTTCITC